MKVRGTKRFGCIAATALLAVSALSFPAAAEEGTEAVTEAEAKAETEIDTCEVTIDEDGDEVTLNNKTDAVITDVTYTPKEGETEGTLEITEENGTEHTFDDADLTYDSDYDVIEKLSFFYVVGEDDEEDEEFWNYEDADEIELSDTVTMYVLADMNIRDDADKDADIIGSAEVGTEVEVTGGTPIWFSVTTGTDEKGYIAARYLTEDKEEAEEAAEAEAASAQTTTAETTAETTQSETAQSETTESETPSAATVDSPNGSGNYYQVDGVWYEDVAPDSDAGGYYYQVDGDWYQDEAPEEDTGYFYYETADGKRYRILDSDAVYIGYDDPAQDEVFGYDVLDMDGTAELQTEDDIDGDVDPYASDAGGY